MSNKTKYSMSGKRSHNSDDADEVANLNTIAGMLNNGGFPAGTVDLR